MKLIIKNIYQKIANLKQSGKGSKSFPEFVHKNRFSKIFLLSYFFVFLNTSFAQECSKTYSALVFDPINGTIFFENQADKIIYPASLTKLMTLYLTFEAIKEKRLSLKDELVASERAVGASKVNKTNTLNLEIGDKVSVEQAIEGSIVKSFNELTVMLAERISGSEWEFSRDMNLAAKDLGMSFTNFHNASGLHNQGQFTTDEDLAILVMAIRRDFPEYFHFFSLKECKYKNQKYLSHNNILLKYKGADGMKTGFTNAAGFNLIASAKRDGKRVISILTGCESTLKRDNFTKQLLDYGFKK